MLSFLHSPTLTSINDYWKNHSLSKCLFTTWDQYMFSKEYGQRIKFQEHWLKTMAVKNPSALDFSNREELIHLKRLWCWGQEEKGMTKDEMVGWHHRLKGHGFGWTPGVGDGQGGLAWCDSWGRKESDMTERLNWTEVLFSLLSAFLLQYNW